MVLAAAVAMINSRDKNIQNFRYTRDAAENDTELSIRYFSLSLSRTIKRRNIKRKWYGGWKGEKSIYFFFF